MSPRIKLGVSLLLILASFHSVRAQGKVADSLHHVLTQNIHDTTRVKVLLELAKSTS